jgi:hypothetical protein
MLNFLTANRIMDLDGLDAHFKGMIDRQFAIRENLKPLERRLKVLDEHIKNTDVYMQFRELYRQYKLVKPKYQSAFYEAHRAGLVRYEAAKHYLDCAMNGKASLPIKAWKAERVKLTDERSKLNGEYISLKDEVKEVERIRRVVYDIMRDERGATRQPRAHGIER